MGLTPRGFCLRLLLASLVIVLTACAQSGDGSSGGGSGSSSNGSAAGNFNPVDPPRRVAWVAPTTYTDGTPLTNLVKYRIYYGGSKDAVSPIMEIPNVGNSYDFTDADQQMIGSLMKQNAAHFFAITAIDDQGLESALSNRRIHDET